MFSDNKYDRNAKTLFDTLSIILFALLPTMLAEKQHVFPKNV